MSFRIFGVGNPLMCDDGVGVAVCRLMEAPANATVVQGEIFVAECLADIEEGDTVVILDAVRLSKPAGTVVTLPFEECKRYFPPKAFCHDVSLLHSLLYGAANVRGFLIGIQAAEIDYAEGLSSILSDRLPGIVEQVNREVAAIYAGFRRFKTHGK